mgnify:CR=1 FL=1
MVAIPVIAKLPVPASIVTAVPTLIPPFAVTIPANAALPAVVIVAPVLTLTVLRKVEIPVTYTLLDVVTPVILTP